MAIEITEQWLMDNRTERGAWTRAQLKIIGVGWPPTNGWKKRVIGTLISDIEAKAFRDSRAITGTSRERRRTWRSLQSTLPTEPEVKPNIPGSENIQAKKTRVSLAVKELRLALADLGSPDMKLIDDMLMAVLRWLVSQRPTTVGRPEISINSHSEQRK